MSTRSAGALAAGLLLMGCLVTEKVDYPVVNSPPSFTRISPAVITRIPARPPLACSSRKGNSLELEIDVRDEDVGDSLEGRVFVNGNFVTSAGFIVQVSGTAQRPTVSLCVTADPLTFSRACNLLEVLVSRQFKGGTDATVPKEAGDLARGQLLVLASVADEPGASSQDCDNLMTDGDSTGVVEDQP